MTLLLCWWGTWLARVGRVGDARVAFAGAWAGRVTGTCTHKGSQEVVYREVSTQALGSNLGSDTYQIHEHRPNLSEHLSPLRSNNANGSLCLIGSG